MFGLFGLFVWSVWSIVWSVWDFIVWSITNKTINIKKLKGMLTTTSKTVKTKEKAAAIIMRAVNKKSSNVGINFLNSLGSSGQVLCLVHEYNL